MTVMAPVPRLLDNSPSGFWRVWVYPNGDRSDGAVVDVSFVRGAPTSVEALTTTDPYGPAAATLVFPSITLLDQMGSSDLSWLRPEVDVDICWMTPGQEEPVYRWEGYMVAFDFAAGEVGGSLTVSCYGAMRQMDNYLAKPMYVYQPMPYEVAIGREFTGKPDMRLAPLRVEFPAKWGIQFRLADYASKELYYRPVGVEDGANWTGFLTRLTGSFNRSLTEYVQGLLLNMYTPNGRWTLDLDAGRRPVLRVREHLTHANEQTLVVDLLNPGVSMTANRDYTQTLNVVYGQGKSLNGSTFSGMRANADGTVITYEPYAYRRQVHPTQLNDWFDRETMRKEVNLGFYEGLSEDEARTIAKDHLRRFSDPGAIGTITLKSDPIFGHYTDIPTYFPRQLIRAGMSVLVKGIFGNPEGMLFHITECQVSADAVTLSVDSKYRDQLTVQEVKMRTRDALTPIRLLTVGQYKNPVPDMLFPWSYSDGSGFIPKGSQNLFDGMPNSVVFPWTDWTRQRPPGNPQWADQYIHIGPTSSNADHNWAVKSGGLEAFQAYAVRMSQAGEAKSIQIAAYDRYGNVLKVPFHVSLYRTSGVKYSSMPQLGIDDARNHPPYQAGQHYPFFKRAWEQYTETGQALNPDQVGAVQTAQIIIGYGNYYEKAGYWPLSSAAVNAEPTGLLVEESGFSWDLTDATNMVNPQLSREENMKDVTRADIYVMIYCDAQLTQDVYFLGRIFRKEPGSA